MIESSTQPYRVIVAGGGITGLAAFRELGRARAARPVSAFLIEAGDRWGGLIRTECVDGFTIEAGPDSFLTGKPEAAELCRDLGLGAELIGSNDAARRTGILYRGRLETLPDGLYFVVPTRLAPIITTPLLPLPAKLLMARDLFIRPARNSEGGAEDESVARFMRLHFGRAMLENIVDPLLRGIYGGDSERLSMRSVLPGLWEMEKKHGSLIRAVLRARTGAAGAGQARPIFTTLRHGLGELIGRLVPPPHADHPPGESPILLQTRLAKIEINCSSPAQPGSRAARYTIRFDSGKSLEADAIILALPAHESGRLLRPLSPALGAALGGISYSPALTVALAFNETAARQLPQDFGFLVPKKEGRRMLACTFVHQKFSHRAPAGKALLRCFFGGTESERLLETEDREILQLARTDLGDILGLRAEPLFHRLYRLPRAMPQYNVGHEKRWVAIQEELKNLPGMFLAGNSYSGIGISDCIRTGQTAAQQALQFLAADR